MPRKRYIIIIIAIAVIVPLSIVLTVMASRPPVIDSLEAESKRVFPSGSTQVTCTVSTADSAALTYEWSADGGEIDGNGPMITWRAPAREGFHRISVNVTDRRGHEATDHIMITVKANQDPVIYSVTAGEEWTAPGGSLEVACDAEDFDDHSLSYNWSASTGHFEGAGPGVTWIAPEEVGIYDIVVTVSDDYGGSATSTLFVSVMPDRPPDVEALVVTKDRYGHCYLIEYDWGYKVGKGQKYDIECIVSATAVDLVYQWSCDGGEISEISEDGSMITWIAPSTATYVRVTVIVSDIVGNTAPPASVSLDVVSCSPCTFRDCG